MKNFLAALWKTIPSISAEGKIIMQLQLGIIAKKSDGDESWCAYMGSVDVEKFSTDLSKERKDIEKIMKHGAKLLEAEARAWFPDIELKYRN